MEVGKCPVCSKKADKTCSACHSVSYCSSDHQKRHWKEHKKTCRIYLVKKNDVFGRYLVAARDITAGTIILNDAPLAYGPKQNTRPICLGCYKILDGTYTCSKCHLPMCSLSCEEEPAHAENECQVFQRCKSIPKVSNFVDHHPIYESIVTVRCLMLRDRSLKLWQALNQMEPHNEIRKGMIELWHRNQVNTVEFLRSRCNMESFDEDCIHSVLGFCDVNSFEIRSHGVEICGIYPNVCLMAHDCISNTHHSVTEDYRMVVRASVPIKKGEMITTVYTHTLDGTLERRQYIKESKFFDCVCKRCADPTELGTHLSSIKCQKGRCTGYLTPVNPLDKDVNWTCDNCENKLPVQKVQKLVGEIKEEMDAIKEGESLIPSLENLLEKHSEITVHKNHYLMISIVHSLSELYGRTKGWLIDDLSTNLLRRKEQHCRDLLQVLDIIEPGMTRIRGLTMYELHAALYFIAQREFTNDAMTADELKVQLDTVLQLLRDAQEILLFDCPNTPEGVIAKTIDESINGVNQVIKHCCNTTERTDT
ncbi:unnamed protein product [Allacma fusca]|uniref:Protein msta n=1 Tax=Allacma fusca TaxID=39272 RepID=A0A8J2KH65_9HEXA|nr:unnamed protein product [Allacma fusca]